VGKLLQGGRNVAVVRPNGAGRALAGYLDGDQKEVKPMALRRLRLAQRRKALGHSQDDLAALVGVDRTTVIRWERAETEPQPWLRRKLATHLRVTPEEPTELLEAVSEVPTRRDGYTLLSSVPLDFSLLLPISEGGIGLTIWMNSPPPSSSSVVGMTAVWAG